MCERLRAHDPTPPLVRWRVHLGVESHRPIPRCAALGIDAELVPVDLPLGAPAEAHRRLVANLGADQEAVGAVVTTHWSPCSRPPPSGLPPAIPQWTSSRRSRASLRAVEASRPTLSIHGARPGRCLRCFPGPSTRSALVLGAGGAGTAVAAALLMDRTSPWTVTLTDTAGDRLARAERILSALSVRNRAVLVPASGSEENDGALAKAPPDRSSSMRPGWGRTCQDLRCQEARPSPSTGWCGTSTTGVSLLFLDQARAQARHRGLRVEDGRRLFVHGWADGLGQIFRSTGPGRDPRRVHPPRSEIVTATPLSLSHINPSCSSASSRVSQLRSAPDSGIHPFHHDARRSIRPAGRPVTRS